MDRIIQWIAEPLGYVMQWCYTLVADYGIAILLFTLMSKIILLPLSVWVQKNSIKMVQIQPQINRIKAKYFGDGDAIANEESKLYRQAKYHPLAGLIPLAAQLILLMGVVAVIYHPFEYLFHFPAEGIEAIKQAASQATGVSVADNSIELAAINAVKAGTPLPGVADEWIARMSSFDLVFCGVNLSLVPLAERGLTLLVPLVAGLSSFVMCYTQNVSNVLQAEQSAANRYGMLTFSVCLSLYLGCGVPAGIALYWIASNLLAVAQLYALNAVIPPKKYVDYAALDESRKELAALNNLEVKRHDPEERENKKREKADYKRFFSVANKHLVFYSERSGFYKYYDELIAWLLKKTNVVIHYVTNDPHDAIFQKAQQQPRIKPYYIGIKKMISLMMKMDADIVVMTTPDLDNLYLKRSIVRKDVEYVFVPHDPSSMHMGFREHALDHFDTVFCTGPHIAKEVRASEAYYGTKEKTLVEFGYPLIEQLIEACEALPPSGDAKKRILIAPSWQEDNLLDSCVDDLIASLYGEDYEIVVRPHPEYMKRYAGKMEAFVERHADQVGKGLTFELDFSSNTSVYSSDLLITDWSGIGIEFGFATLKPVIFVNTKMKVENENYEAIGIQPQEIALRSVLGEAIDKADAGRVKSIAEQLLANRQFTEEGRAMRERYFYHLGSKGRYGANYLIDRLVKNSQKGGTHA